MPIKYVHTNLIAKDWKKLTKFYIDVFGCKPVLPERHLSGEWVQDLTNIENVTIDGIHLSLPGFIDGPTLEIFQYKPDKLNETNLINKRGFAHIAFHVDNVEDVLNKVIENRGSKLGEIVRKYIEGVGNLTVVYAKDPEGNFIEIQNWEK
jgi:predicted enzyme related to lactoylglutathione lyase